MTEKQLKEYVKLIRDKATGDYYTPDRLFHVEKCDRGYNLYQMTETGEEYICSPDDLWETRKEIDIQYRTLAALRWIHGKQN